MLVFIDLFLRQMINYHTPHSMNIPKNHFKRPIRLDYISYIKRVRWKKHQSSPDLLTCPFADCGMTFSGDRQIRTHMREHDLTKGNALYCKRCARLFSSKGGIARHFSGRDPCKEYAYGYERNKALGTADFRKKKEMKPYHQTSTARKNDNYYKTTVHWFHLGFIRNIPIGLHAIQLLIVKKSLFCSSQDAGISAFLHWRQGCSFSGTSCISWATAVALQSTDPV